jgi:hypothetical protein
MLVGSKLGVVQFPYTSMPVSIKGRAAGGAVVEGMVVVGGAVVERTVMVGGAVVERMVVVGGAVAETTVVVDGAGGRADLVVLTHPVAKTAMPAQESATTICLARPQPTT